MKYLRTSLDKLHPHFDKGGKLEKLYPIYEAIDTFLYSPGHVTKGTTHVRDGLDSKRMMITVAIALLPCGLMALYNTGYQANLAMANMGVLSDPGWRGFVIETLGVGYDYQSIIPNFLHGALYFIPIFLVCNLVGGFWEGLFATISLFVDVVDIARISIAGHAHLEVVVLAVT